MNHEELEKEITEKVKIKMIDFNKGINFSAKHSLDAFNSFFPTHLRSELFTDIGEVAAQSFINYLIFQINDSSEGLNESIQKT